ncbi:MAG: RES family NAD+ phosphorylase [Alphaproteobacteria bacterium]|nr:RES family NAD+ phosphorylase [Alphaproteobacteria bacterium]
MSHPIWNNVTLSFNFMVYDQICWHAVNVKKIEDGKFESTVKKILPNLDTLQCRKYLEKLGIDLDRSEFQGRKNQTFAAKSESSRFYCAGDDLGVLYVSENAETAIAEMGYYFWLYFAQESPGSLIGQNPARYKVFSVKIITENLIDMSNPEFAEIALACLDKNNNIVAQQFAAIARKAGTTAIRYPSVRAPDSGQNLAILLESALGVHHKTKVQNWQLHIRNNIIFAERETPKRKIQIEIPQESQQIA